MRVIGPSRKGGSPICGILAAASCCLLSAFLTAGAHAAGTVLSTGFENYALGPLQGQFGWVSAGAGTSSATVQNSIAHTGSQAVEVVKAPAANSDHRWAVPMSGLPSQRFIIIDWDMRVSPTMSQSGFGPFFGIEAYDADVAPYVLGSLGVDATTGDVLYQVQDSGVLAETGIIVNFNQWNHYRLVLDFATDTYRGYVNGQLAATTGFVDRVRGLDNFTDADIAALAAGDDAVSKTLSASAVFDNLLIRDGLLGDYNNDGVVNVGDYTQWRSTFGTTISPVGNVADGNADGRVDAADYVLWRANLGTSIGASPGAAVISTVPEPKLMLILCSFFPALGLHPRRRHQLPLNVRKYVRQSRLYVSEGAE